MTMRKGRLIGAAIVAAALATTPAFAGNGGSQSNGQQTTDETVTRNTPDAVTVTRPEISERAAYIDQIGSGDNASIRQTAPTAYAKVTQTGDENEARVDQGGSATDYANVVQRGDRNIADVTQNGIGDNILYTSQRGNDNRIAVGQSGDGGVSNGAILAQYGDANDINLTQNGDDNQAQLTQNGEGNAMTATQNGAANQLVWTQTGNNLSDLGITQNGGQAMQVTQTR